MESSRAFLPVLSDVQYVSLVLIGLPAMILAIAFRLLSGDRVVARLVKWRESGGWWLRSQIDWHVRWNLWGGRIFPVVAIICGVVFIADTFVRLVS